VLFLFFLFAVSVNAETPRLWYHTFGGADYDNGQGVAVDSNGNVIVVGDTSSFGAGGYDFWTVKYDSNGNLQWNKTLGGSGHDTGQGVAVDPNNNIVVVGYTFSFGAGNGDFWTVKYDPNGNLLWNRTIGGGSSDYAYSVAVDSNNNIIVVGETHSFGAGSYDFWTVKYDSNGNLQWNRTLGGSGSDNGYAVAVDSSNNIIASGRTNSFGAGLNDFWTVKYDSDGNQLWNKTSGGNDSENGYGVAVDSNNNIIVTGPTSSFGAGNSDFWTVKYDSNGNQLWNKTLGGSSIDNGFGVAVDLDNDIVVAGYTFSFGAGAYDFWTVKYDSNGNQLWNKTLGGSSSDYGFEVAADSNNNIVVTGYTQSYGVENTDFLTVKYGTPVCDDGIDNDLNGLTDCDDLECANTHLCKMWNKTSDLWNRSFTPQPTIVTLQGRLTNASSGIVVDTGSMYVDISNSTGEVWGSSFNDVLRSGVFNIPLGAATELKLIPNNVYSMTVMIDVDSTTYSTADVTFGDESPSGDIIKFTA